MNIPWHQELIDTMDVKSHIFWHSTSLTAADELQSSLEASTPEGRTLRVLDCEQLPLEDGRDLDVHAIESTPCDILIVLNFDALLTISRGRSWMRQLRPAVMHHVKIGTRLIVGSRLPQSDYPAIDGSSLAIDCIQFVASPLKSLSLDGQLPEHEVQKLLNLAAGLPGPASEIFLTYPDVRHLSTRKANQIVKKRIIDAMIQSGAEVISWLEQAVLLGKNRVWDYEEVPPKVAAIIQGAGLGILDARTDCLEILPGMSSEMIYECIEDAERSFVRAPKQWIDVAAALFTFERTARRSLVDFAGTPEKLVDLLSQHADKIRAIFRAEHGVTAPPLNQLPNPVRWIDLSDLLDLLVHSAANARISGLSSKQWLQAKNDLLPLRNKIQHMRLPSVGDKELVDRYNRRLRNQGNP